jgi:hypothetical protein
MESGDEQREKPRRERAFIKSPLKLAIFSIAILMLGTFAVRLIAEGEPLMSAADSSTSSTLF